MPKLLPKRPLLRHKSNALIYKKGEKAAIFGGLFCCSPDMGII